MSIWGKILGGVAGFVLGGPLGALVGTAFGHAIDRSTTRKQFAVSDEDIQARQTAFTVAVIVLGAKMAKADGTVTRNEINTFKKVFNIPPNELVEVGRLFDEARRDAEGYEPYANQIGSMFAHDTGVMENLLGGLFQIALADGVMHPKELKFLENVSKSFGMSSSTFSRIRAMHVGGEYSDPYEVLGVSSNASDDEVKNAYRKLIRDNHPDLLIAKGVPQEFIELANKKMSEINTAYEKIEKARTSV